MLVMKEKIEIINKLKGNKCNLNQYIIIDRDYFIKNFDDILRDLSVYDHYKKYKKMIFDYDDHNINNGEQLFFDIVYINNLFKIKIDYLPNHPVLRFTGTVIYHWYIINHNDKIYYILNYGIDYANELGGCGEDIDISLLPPMIKNIYHHKIIRD